MLNSVALDTEEFLAWLGDKVRLKARRLSKDALKAALTSKFCALVCREGSRLERHGTVVLVDKDRVREFHAFVSTYVLDYAPFSAFFRVITTDQIDLLDEIDRESQKYRADRDIVTALSGVAIAEAALYLQARDTNGQSRSATLPAANATYSAVILQGLALGAAGDITAIGQAWISLRALLSGDELPLDARELERFWGVIRMTLFADGTADLADEDALLHQALRSVMESGRIDDAVLVQLFSTVPQLDRNLSRFRGPREERARAVQEALAVVANSAHPGGLLRDCIAGCLLSLLGDGSFKFLATALSLSSTLPTAALWFAAWSGFQKSNDVMTSFHCLGRRIVRGLVAPKQMFDVPVDDISIWEAAIGGLDLNGLPREHSGSISVEIYPNVSSRQRLPKANSGSSTSTVTWRPSELAELRYLIDRSSAVLATLESAPSGAAGAGLQNGSNRGVTRRKRLI